MGTCDGFCEIIRGSPFTDLRLTMPWDKKAQKMRFVGRVVVTAKKLISIGWMMFGYGKSLANMSKNTNFQGRLPSIDIEY